MNFHSGQERCLIVYKRLNLAVRYGIVLQSAQRDRVLLKQSKADSQINHRREYSATAGVLEQRFMHPNEREVGQ